MPKTTRKKKNWIRMCCWREIEKKNHAYTHKHSTEGWTHENENAEKRRKRVKAALHILMRNCPCQLVSLSACVFLKTSFFDFVEFHAHTKIKKNVNNWDFVYCSLNRIFESTKHTCGWREKKRGPPPKNQTKERMPKCDLKRRNRAPAQLYAFKISV